MDITIEEVMDNSLDFIIDNPDSEFKGLPKFKLLQVSLLLKEGYSRNTSFEKSLFDYQLKNQQ